MIIERVTGFINFQLEERDFKYDWESFIAQVKKQIPSKERSYDDQSCWWSILDTETNWIILHNLKKEFLTNQNQMNLLDDFEDEDLSR
jgi:hypothetical protein